MKMTSGLRAGLRVAWIGVAVLVLVTGQYFFLPAWYRDADIRTSGWFTMLAVAAGITLSAWLLDIIIKKFLAGQPVDIFGLATTARTGSKIGAYLVTIVSYPFALFLGIVVGGNVGGGFGGNAGNAGIIVGIGLGMFIIATLVGVVAASAGFVLGRLMEKLTWSTR
jgi:hypothetical protein